MDKLPDASLFTFVKHFQHFDKSGLTNREKFCLLVDGYWRTSGEKMVDHDAIGLIKDYCHNGLPFESLAHISIVNVLATMIYDFMNDEKNKCEFSNFSDFNLLNYIYIKGGMLRDLYLLNNINDIDITIDIYQVTRHFKRHLKKYHSNHNWEEDTNIKCILWRRCLNMFNNNNSDTNENGVLQDYMVHKEEEGEKQKQKQKQKKERRRHKQHVHKHKCRYMYKQNHNCKIKKTVMRIILILI